jgi:putative ABC transport system permease protein
MMLTDLRYSIRMLRKNAGFNLAVIGALALGIGATTAMFTGVNAILLRPLPYPDADRLFMVRERRAQAGFARTVVASGEFLRWQSQSRSLEAVASVDYPSLTLTIGSEPESVSGLRVSAGFFRALGIQPEVGRAFTADEDRAGAPPVILISHDLWQQRFASSPGVVGSTIRMDGRLATMIGVLPRGFSFLGQIDAVVPAAPGASEAADFSHHFLDIVGLLRRGATRSQAEAELATLATSSGDPTPAHLIGVALVPLQEEVVGAARPSLLVLFGAVTLVLVIACANIANLLLARATAREKEIGIRVALGAERGRVVRQLVCESLILALAGGALGVVLSLWGADLLVAISPPGTPRLDEIGVDWRVLTFALALSCGAGALFGLAPAWHAARVDASAIIIREARAGAGSPARRRLLHGFVAAELALALVLLIGATLLAASLRALNHVDPGFDPIHVLTVPLALPDARYDEARERQFYRELLTRVESTPGVVASGLVNVLPLSGNNSSGSITIEGQTVPRPEDQPNVNIRMVSAGYFRAMGITLMRGRGLTGADTAESARVIIVNARMASLYWGTEDPIGQRVKIGRPTSTEPWLTVVGVVRDVRHRALGAPPRQEMYLPYEQRRSQAPVLVVRAAGDPGALTASIRHQIRALDPDLPVTGQPLSQIVRQSLQGNQLNARLVGVFALVALLLAAGGLYAVMAYAVSLRMHEFGVRVALGASRRDLATLVVRQALVIAAAGLALGLPAAWATSRMLTALLYAVSPTDPRILAATAAVLTAVALVASCVPARRATKVNPIDALRLE